MPSPEEGCARSVSQPRLAEPKIGLQKKSAWNKDCSLKMFFHNSNFRTKISYYWFFQENLFESEEGTTNILSRDFLPRYPQPLSWNQPEPKQQELTQGAGSQVHSQHVKGSWTDADRTWSRRQAQDAHTLVGQAGPLLYCSICPLLLASEGGTV